MNKNNKNTSDQEKENISSEKSVFYIFLNRHKIKLILFSFFSISLFLILFLLDSNKEFKHDQNNNDSNNSTISMEKELVDTTVLEKSIIENQDEVSSVKTEEGENSKIGIKEEQTEENKNKEIVKEKIAKPQTEELILSQDLINPINIPIYIYIILSLSLLLALSGVWLSFYLYKWRKKLLTQDNGTSNQIIVPELFWEQQNNLISHYRELNQGVNLLHQHINNILEKNDELLTNFLRLQNALDERDSEIKKLKEGYDQGIFKKFLRRFIKTHQATLDLKEDGELNQEIEQILFLLNDALDEAGVEIFNPEINQLYAKTEGLSESPKTVYTSNEDDIGRIAKINEPGYRIKTPSGYEYIIPAKVTVFISHTQEEN